MFTDKITLAIAEAAKKCMDEDLKGKQHKIDANKNGKVDAQDFKILRKEDSMNEEEGKYGYVAFSHDGKRHEVYANSSYEAHQKAVTHFNPPKSKRHLVHVHLAQKDGKDVTHVATESVQEGAIDDLRDRQAAAREKDTFKTPAKSTDNKRTVQGSSYGGSKQKAEKEIDEETMSATDKAQRENIVKGMKKNIEGFKQRYGSRAKDVMYATATKQAMKEETRSDFEASGEQYRAISNKNASKNTIDSALSSNNPEHRRLAALHNNASSEHLHKALGDESRFVREAAARNKNATPEHIHKALDDKEPYNRIHAAENSNASKENLHKALDDKDTDVRGAAARNKNASSEHLHKALDDKEKFVRRNAAENPNATHEHLHKALDDSHSDVRESAARNANASKENLHKALDDRNPEVRRAAIKHPNITKEHLDKAIHDNKHEVVHAAITHPKATKEHLDVAVNHYSTDVRKSVAAHPKATKEHLGKLASDHMSDVRREVASNSNTSSKHLSALAKDNNESVRVSAVRNRNYSLKEEVEELDEVSKATLSRYINRAKDEEGTKDRSKGVRLALRKKYGDVGYGFPAPKVRATEEVEQIDELSKDTLQSYTKKATADKDDSLDRYNRHDRDAQGKKIADRDRSPARRAIDKLLFKRVDKRIEGLKSASAKLSKEEVDNETFTKEVEDQKKSAAGTKKQPDVAKAAVQGVKSESFTERYSSIMKEHKND